VRARDVVHATHVPFPLRGGFFATCTPHRAYAVASPIDPADVPQGMYLSAEQPTRSLRPVTTASGDLLLLVGGEGHLVGEDDVGSGHYERLEHWGRMRFGVGEPTHRWSTQDVSTPDHVPFIGRLSGGAEHEWVATGFGGWGMAGGAAAAILLRDLLVDGESTWERTFDSTRRIALVRGARELLGHNLHVGARFAHDRLGLGRDRRDPEELEPGEACVMSSDDGPVAAHRDAGGELHVVSAVCTHMGCNVAWNGAEATWDCPCHGSRFDVDGGVLEGPAKEPLGARTRSTRTH
jgi:nitrite reductase/ring-hydroxylating ferredoxin subunit